MGADFDGLASEGTNRESALWLWLLPLARLSANVDMLTSFANCECDQLLVDSDAGKTGHRRGCRRRRCFDSTRHREQPWPRRCSMFPHRVRDSRLLQRCSGDAELGWAGLSSGCWNLWNSTTTGPELMPSIGPDLAFRVLRVSGRLKFLAAWPQAKTRDPAFFEGQPFRSNQAGCIPISLFQAATAC